MSAVRDNIYDFARLVASIRTFQSPLPATGMGVTAQSRQLGTIGSERQRSESNAGPVHIAPMGRTTFPHRGFSGEQAVARDGMEYFLSTHHPCLGLERNQPYSALGGEQFMSRKALDELKQQIPLLDYLEEQDWEPVRRIARGRFMGLCPLHADHKPSFLLDPHKNLFYCYGCGRGGDVIRFAELYHGLPFSEAVALLRRWCDVGSLLSDVAKYYQVQLHRHPEAVEYLQQRGLYQPEIIEQLRIGYAPGRCLRAWLMSLGYPLRYLQRAGVVTLEGFDTLTHRIVFPLEGNLYGRSIGKAAPHQLLPGGKGGLYGWEKVRACPEIILVEGLFDLAVLWQAGFRNATCSMGIFLNATQIQQLCDGAARVVYLAFDSDRNGSGQHAAGQIAQRLWAQGSKAFPVELPDDHDPNSFFVSGGDARQFRLLLQRAHS
jgi:DNA primase